jgi:hypothetical protein
LSALIFLIKNFMSERIPSMLVVKKGIEGGVETISEAILNPEEMADFFAWLAPEEGKENPDVSVRRSSGTVENDWKFASVPSDQFMLAIKRTESDGLLKKEVPVEDFCIHNQGLIEAWKKWKQTKADEKASLAEMRQQIEVIDRSVGSGDWDSGLDDANKQVADLEDMIRKQETELKSKYGIDMESTQRDAERMAEIRRLESNLDERVAKAEKLKKEEEERKELKAEAPSVPIKQMKPMKPNTGEEKSKTKPGTPEIATVVENQVPKQVPKEKTRVGKRMARVVNDSPKLVWGAFGRTLSWLFSGREKKSKSNTKK